MLLLLLLRWRCRRYLAHLQRCRRRVCWRERGEKATLLLLLPSVLLLLLRLHLLMKRALVMSLML